MTEQNRRATTTKKELFALGYHFFGDSQGSQPLQLHFTQAIVRRMLEEQHYFDPTVLARIEQHMASNRPPTGHKALPIAKQKPAQMRFWGQNLLTVISTAVNRNSAALPSRRELEERAWQTGGTRKMSSYTDEEFTKLTAAFDIYRENEPTISSYEVMTNLLLPELVSVESVWQTKGRPRTDMSDKYESVWRRYSQTVHEKVAGEKPLTTRDQLYVDMAVFMEDAEVNRPGSELVGNYQELLDLYNARHETAPVAALYR